MRYEDNDVDADCLEYPKVKRAVERFQKLYESISGEDVVGWTPKSGHKAGRRRVCSGLQSQEGINSR